MLKTLYANSATPVMELKLYSHLLIHLLVFFGEEGISQIKDMLLSADYSNDKISACCVKVQWFKPCSRPFGYYKDFHCPNDKKYLNKVIYVEIMELNLTSNTKI